MIKGTLPLIGKIACWESPKPLNKRKDGGLMVNRTRPIILRLAVSEAEKKMIEKKMEQIGTKNFGAYARKMLIDGYVIKVDYTEQKKLAAAVNKIGGNINAICRRMQSTGHFYQDDINELKEKLDQIWQSLRSKQSEEL